MLPDDVESWMLDGLLCCRLVLLAAAAAAAAVAAAGMAACSGLTDVVDVLFTAGSGGAWCTQGAL
jgi:hypothetical protein